MFKGFDEKTRKREKEANASSKYEENFMMFLMSCCSRSFRLLRKIIAQ